MVMAGRFERLIRARRPRITPRTTCDIKHPSTTFTTGVHDPVRSAPGSTTSHQPDRCGDRSCVSPPTACAVTSRQRRYRPTWPSSGPGWSRSSAGWPNRPTATRGTTTPAPAQLPEGENEMATNYPHSSPEPANAQVPQEPEATVRALPGAVAADGQAGPSDRARPAAEIPRPVSCPAWATRCTGMSPSCSAG